VPKVKEASADLSSAPVTGFELITGGEDKA
jgi:hypothetical protein